MDLSLLRGFAAGVRVELVGVVGARLAGVLLPGSVERVEFPEAVRRLEGVIARLSRDVVVDQVAYTWFNRLVALRFMDVNGYTAAGVVSPAGGAVTGQPEVLADAKAGHVDAGVVGEKVRDRVIGLLSGSVVSRDGQGEAYKLLLAAYCNHWAGPMPFMFERSGDFTELLVPDDLLSERSIVARIVRTLTPEACADVEVIGWLYQFYIAARKDEVFAGFKKNKKATALEIPAATQLFTPHWIVKYLVENSLGRLWLLNNPGSELASRMEYYVAPVEPETDFLRISGPEELKVLDPACGSGHMLTYAFDLLFLMYEEAGYAPSDISGLILKHNLFGAEIDPRAGALAAFALAMKARDKQKSFLNPGKGTEPNICVLKPVRFTTDELEMLLTRGGDKAAEIAFWQAFEDADTFGSLIRPNQDLIEPLRVHLESLGGAETLFGGDVLERAHKVIRQSEYLSTRYHVVVANPPYMGSSNFGSRLANFTKREYPESKADLFATFIQRGFELLCPKAYCAMVTMQSWMFLPSYEGLRASLLRDRHIECMVHMGNGVMGIAFGTSGTVWSNTSKLDTVSSFSFVSSADIINGKPIVFPVPGPRNLIAYTKDFADLPGSPIAYWASTPLRETFRSGRRVEDVAPVRQGFQTGDNDRFMRFWFEVSRSKIGNHCQSIVDFQSRGYKFAPYLKGGPFRKWYGNDEYVVAFDPENSAKLAVLGNKLPSKDRYFKESLTWSAMSSGSFGARYSGPGNTFSAKGACAFPSSHANGMLILAILNSHVSSMMFEFMGATMDFNVGAIRALPLPAHMSDDMTAEVTSTVEDLISIHKKDWCTSEYSGEFVRNPLLDHRGQGLVEVAVESMTIDWTRCVQNVKSKQTLLDEKLFSAYGLEMVARSEAVTLVNADLVDDKVRDAKRRLIQDLTSYAVGCIFGRYSLDVPGLVLADQDDSLVEYLVKVPSPSFMPDRDNVLPVLSDAWFEDDIVERFREFLKQSFGEEHFEENLRFVEEALGKDIRKYFVQDFYKDHVQRYKKRPIYWLFSSPKGSFNALIYMHRYRPDTVSVVLNDYLHEFQAKLRARRANVDQVALSALSSVKEQTVARKESEQIGKVLLELEEWEQSVLYPLATQQVALDLDDGVKANYPKFGMALKKIVGLEANE